MSKVKQLALFAMIVIMKSDAMLNLNECGHLALVMLI